jgi:hypothetical protein
VFRVSTVSLPRSTLHPCFPVGFNLKYLKHETETKPVANAFISRGREPGYNKRHVGSENTCSHRLWSWTLRFAWVAERRCFVFQLFHHTGTDDHPSVLPRFSQQHLKHETPRFPWRIVQEVSIAPITAEAETGALGTQCGPSLSVSVEKALSTGSVAARSTDVSWPTREILATT